MFWCHNKLKQISFSFDRITKLISTWDNTGSIHVFTILHLLIHLISTIPIWSKRSGNRKSTFQTLKMLNSSTLLFPMFWSGLTLVDKFSTCSGKNFCLTFSLVSRTKQSIWICRELNVGSNESIIKKYSLKNLKQYFLNVSFEILCSIQNHFQFVLEESFKR